MKFKTVLPTVLSIASAVAAVPRDAAAETCDTLKCTGAVKRLYVSSEGSPVMIRMDEDRVPQGHPCQLVSGMYWAVNPEDEKIFRLLFQAFNTGRQISVRFDPTKADCTVDYVFQDL